MIGDLSKRIVERLLRNEAIIQSDYEIYLFGMEQMLTIILDLLTAVIIGIAFGRVLQTIIFMIAFMVIRSYAGGYHASTSFRCYLLTTLTIIITLSAMKFVNLDMVMLISLLVIASIVILIISPEDTENKPLDDIEYIYYRKKTIIVWSIEIVIALICAIFRFEAGTESIVYAQTVLSIALICQRITRIKNKKF